MALLILFLLLSACPVLLFVFYGFRARQHLDVQLPFRTQLPKLLPDALRFAAAWLICTLVATGPLGVLGLGASEESKTLLIVIGTVVLLPYYAGWLAALLLNSLPTLWGVEAPDMYLRCISLPAGFVVAFGFSLLVFLSISLVEWRIMRDRLS